MRKSILLVEDDDIVRMLTAEVLEEFGYQVLCAEDGESALLLLQDKSIDIDLLLTDLGLPGINGQELAHEACKTRPRLAVLLASGFVHAGQIDSLAANGALASHCDVIGKPFTLEQIRDKVSAMIDR